MSSAALKLLRDSETSAVALLAATRALIGDFDTWEPESIWLGLSHAGVDVSVANRAKIMAGLTLWLMPSFYWDAIVFEKTAVAFEGYAPTLDILEEPHPAWLAWAITESDMILRRRREGTWEIGYEPRAYTGVVLARAGFVLAPDTLQFAQTQLDRHVVDPSLRESVAERWSKLRGTRLDALALDESREDVQIARLAAVELHVRARRERAERELGSLA